MSFTSSGGSSTLTWTTDCLTKDRCTCTASGDWSSIGNKTSTGGSESTGTLTTTTSNTITKNYSLTCANFRNVAGPSCGTTVNVNPDKEIGTTSDTATVSVSDFDRIDWKLNKG